MENVPRFELGIIELQPIAFATWLHVHSKKTEDLTKVLSGLSVVAHPGFEPGNPDYEPGVLPLD